ncbi:MAG: 5-oxoprolinase subunit PxpA [Saccharospirillaceae bacterium]|nr:5-oxoprolinase subunit PxpA [Pseudomonadales bacterium]NRB78437.1 5-oxoprolinase subunit PxpA [Saccharospirillaceae bacterium]
MKLNCDLGESFGNWKMGLDEQVMPFIDQANIACGFHAGDPLVILNTLKLAKQHNVTIGAHPSYPDLVGFGRRSMKCSKQEIIAMMLYQISAIDGMAKSLGLNLEYVKPHGALYNDMMLNPNVRNAIFDAIRQYPKKLKLMCQATKNLEAHKKEAQTFNIEILAEVFADRCYLDDGSLMPRGEIQAVHNQQKTLGQVEQLMKTGTVTTNTGKTLIIQADSLCVHGDNIEAVNMIQTIRDLIQGE